MKTVTNIIYIACALFALACFAPAPQAQAACQEGCFTNGNTVLGDDALLTRTGSSNTAVGSGALRTNTTGGSNTALGFNALYSNKTMGNLSGDGNTATGANALYTNTTGDSNTATGQGALKTNSTGSYNTAVGWQALFNNTISTYNTAVGYVALQNNSTGTQNTAIGVSGLRFNSQGSYNTATGVNALYNNTTINGVSGDSNTANGVNALFNNTTGDHNSAIGHNALFTNTIGGWNIAIGNNALYKNLRGTQNTAVGVDALHDNQNGWGNVAIGHEALKVYPSGVDEVAIGHGALNQKILDVDPIHHIDNPSVAIGSGAFSSLDQGENNIGLGWGAGWLIGSWRNGAHSNNIDIGSPGEPNDEGTIRIGTVGTHTSTYIAGISGAVVDFGDPVMVAADGNLGVAPSSARFKEAINPMDKASESIFLLKPVTFRYKKEVGGHGIAQFGLVAEEVDKVNPDLVNRDKEGRPFSVRYEAVNAMLLNEFLKEHRKNEEQQATIAELKSGMVALTAMVKEQASQIQQVNARFELSKAAPQTALNNR